jgi:hypothetical protein
MRALSGTPLAGNIGTAQRAAGRRSRLVLSIVLHNGKRRWSASRETADVIDGAEVIRERAPQLLPRFPVLIDDLARRRTRRFGRDGSLPPSVWPCCS